MSHLLKLRRPYHGYMDEVVPDKSTLTYFFRKDDGKGVTQLQIEINLKKNDQGEFLPESLTCCHYTQHMQWIDVFGEITPSSTDKFGDWDDTDALAYNVATTALAFLRN